MDFQSYIVNQCHICSKLILHCIYFHKFHIYYKLNRSRILSNLNTHKNYYLKNIEVVLLQLNL